MLVLSNNMPQNKNSINVSIKNIFIEDRKFIVNTDFEISRIIKKALQKNITQNLKCSQTKSKAVLRRFVFHRVRLLPHAIKLNVEPPR